jgi:hypothetical protein
MLPFCLLGNRGISDHLAFTPSGFVLHDVELEAASLSPGKSSENGHLEIRTLFVKSEHDPNTKKLAPPARTRFSKTLIFLKKLERAKGFEPSTPTLARLCSTPELRPLWRCADGLSCAGAGLLTAAFALCNPI